MTDPAEVARAARFSRRRGGAVTGMGDGTARAWQGRDGRYHDTRGENSRCAKLTEVQAQAILDAPREGLGRRTSRELAVEYGVSVKTVTAIRRGAAWPHLRRAAP